MDPHPLPTHLSKLLSLAPPQSAHPPSTLTGPLTSHTGLAYLFLAVSADHPRLQVHSYPAIHWARAYISNIPTPSAPLVPFRGGDAASPQTPADGTARSTEDHPVVLGLLSDALASPAVRACITQDLAHVRFFLSLLAPVMDHILAAPAGNAASPALEPGTPPPAPPPPLPTCLLHGLAGTLYLLRLIRHWVPSSAPLVSRAIVHVSEYLLSPSTPWTCPSRSPPHRTPPPPLSERPSPADRHGAAHGDLGTITQLVLTSPPLAPSLAPRLAALLDLQLPNGDWPSPDRRDTPPTPTDPAPTAHGAHPPGPHAEAASGGVGFASGPQGLVISLLSLRPFFPALRGRVDDAIANAREFLWARAREPAPASEANLFYGVLGTALAFPKGPQRTHLLSLASSSPPERQPSPQSAASPAPAAGAAAPGSLMTSASPGSAWAHSVSEREMPRMVFYNDV
ncbi:abscisic acid aba receptor [Colletotrichum tofieldiae]|nr:abscisic acid aba receptor [Colletotrichum tofieldiae]GKT71556.1 abscisic acid aba receptor [Colletotrichum tofieldiae]